MTIIQKINSPQSESPKSQSYHFFNLPFDFTSYQKETTIWQSENQNLTTHYHDSISLVPPAIDGFGKDEHVDRLPFIRSNDLNTGTDKPVSAVTISKTT
ncbi:hypothetical protein KKI24_14645 [bacterium]|nr:hypothetical protein [bacterium]